MPGKCFEQAVKIGAPAAHTVQASHIVDSDRDQKMIDRCGRQARQQLGLRGCSIGAIAADRAPFDFYAAALGPAVGDTGREHGLGAIGTHAGNDGITDTDQATPWAPSAAALGWTLGRTEAQRATTQPHRLWQAQHKAGPEQRAGEPIRIHQAMP